MKTYFLKWYDSEYEEMTTIKINESQKNLIDYLCEYHALEGILRNNNVNIDISEDESQIIDLT